MRIFSATRAVTAVVLAGALVTGCGQDDSSDRPAASDPTTPAATSTATISATPTPTPMPKPKPTRKPKPTGGSGDGEGDNTPATAGGGICADLEATDVGQVLGGTVVGSGLPGGGCAFNQRNSRSSAASFVETSYAGTPGGMDGAKTGATSSVEGDPEDLTGIGEAAFVVTGTAFGGDDIQGAGAVRVGDRLINISLAQSAGLPRAKVRALMVGLLRLAATRAS